MTSSRVAWVSFRALERRVLKGRCDVIASQVSLLPSFGMGGSEGKGVLKGRYDAIASCHMLEESKEDRRQFLAKLWCGGGNCRASCVVEITRFCEVQASVKGRGGGDRVGKNSSLYKETGGEEHCDANASSGVKTNSVFISSPGSEMHSQRVLPDNASIFTPIKKSLDINFDTDDFPPPIPPGREWTFAPSFSTDPTTSHDAEAGVGAVPEAELAIEDVQHEDADA
ncbi:hypothetical protein L3X38_018747 [Prunus dulcis]|uniref:Uncharacterized protein n=1 Tax=Prunus dulcis TaxID=3755 RepID=A0AAD4ZB14_PRUDU|nr:hypothetical protein L3X38_018747 [Prunus dulcis]